MQGRDCILLYFDNFLKKFWNVYHLCARFRKPDPNQCANFAHEVAKWLLGITGQEQNQDPDSSSCFTHMPSPWAWAWSFCQHADCYGWRHGVDRNLVNKPFCLRPFSGKGAKQAEGLNIWFHSDLIPWELPHRRLWCNNFQFQTPKMSQYTWRFKEENLVARAIAQL